MTPTTRGISVAVAVAHKCGIKFLVALSLPDLPSSSNHLGYEKPFDLDVTIES